MSDLISSRYLWLYQDWVAGVLLLIVSVLAIFLANSPFSFWVTQGLETPVILFGVFKLSAHYFINDGLMTVFFFLMGLEIKREMVAGSLSGLKAASLPIVAALGGIVLPALIFWALNIGNADTMKGWAIPCATDIAFALAALSVFGRRVPVSLKVVLLAIAIIDDLVAIGIIALFYTGGVQVIYALAAFLPVAGLYWLNRQQHATLLPYLLFGGLVWVLLWKAGIHTTLAGVITAFFVPMFNRTGSSPVKKLQHTLHLPVVLVIMPLFGFANAGVTFAGIGIDSILSTLTLGIVLGLLVGKPLGVMGAVYIGEKLGFVTRPQGLTWFNVYLVGQLCSIGFTMSLYIGHLAFVGDDALMTEVRLGVITASVLAFFCAVAAFVFRPSDPSAYKLDGH